MTGFERTEITGGFAMTEVQKIILDIFKEISKICEEHNITYFAIGGTCLGAVRHQGFIPWDDDLDIAIPIEEYECFVDVAKKNLPEHLVVFQPGDAKHFYSNFIKVMDTRTMMTEDYAASWRDSYGGVWVDIMPISGVPAETKPRKKFLAKVKWHLRSGFKMKSTFKDQLTLAGKIAWVMYRPLYWILPKEFHWKAWLRLLRRNPFSQSQYTGYVWSKNLHRLIFPTKWFVETVPLAFEDTVIRCPKEWDVFLTQMFGNYMELPPENKRTSGHEFQKGLIDLNNSYLDYQSGVLNVQNLLK